jgi:hypothetical protein
VEEVDQNSQKRDSTQVADINKTNQVVDEDEKRLDATSEIAKTADNQSKGAMSKANQNSKDLNDLRNVVANIDDYKPANQAVVHFAVNKDTLTKDEKAKLPCRLGHCSGTLLRLRVSQIKLDRRPTTISSAGNEQTR